MGDLTRGTKKKWTRATAWTWHWSVFVRKTNIIGTIRDMLRCCFSCSPASESFDRTQKSARQLLMCEEFPISIPSLSVCPMSMVKQHHAYCELNHSGFHMFPWLLFSFRVLLQKLWHHNYLCYMCYSSAMTFGNDTFILMLVRIVEDRWCGDGLGVPIDLDVCHLQFTSTTS